MNIFFDCEFTGLHQKTTLISIGFVAENEKYFYAEFTDFDKNQIDKWLEENILSNLLYSGQSELSIPEWVFVGDSLFIKEKLLNWFSQFDSIELWSDCLSYDWVLLSELIADRKNGYPQMPSNFAYHSPYDILTLFRIKGIDPDINRERFLEWPDSEDKHNALWDARVIKSCYKKLVQQKELE